MYQSKAKRTNVFTSAAGAHSACGAQSNSAVVYAASQAEAGSKRAPSAARKQPSVSTTTAKSAGAKSAGTKTTHTAKVGSCEHNLGGWTRGLPLLWLCSWTARHPPKGTLFGNTCFWYKALKTHSLCLSAHILEAQHLPMVRLQVFLMDVQASNGVSSDSARRTSGRLATRSNAGGSQAAGPARSTRSKSQSIASGLAAVSASVFAMSLHVS